MPLPAPLLDMTAPADHNLNVVPGACPDDLTGALVISAPRPDTFDATKARWRGEKSARGCDGQYLRPAV
jgi:hypothetical protein